MPIIRNCVITGGSGFVGTHLIDYILTHNVHDKIYVLDLVAPWVKHERVLYQFCDVRQPINCQVDNCAVIYNLAALCKEPGYPYPAYFDTNHTGSITVCDFAARNGISTIIFTSTMMVFSAGEEAMTEASATYPDTAYGISKLLGEKAHEAWLAGDPTRVLKIVRPAVVFGKYESGNYTRLYQVLRRGLFVYMGRKTTVKAGLYVKDLVHFLVWCYRNSARYGLYNLAFPETLTIQHICETICKVMNFRKPFLVAPFRLALVTSYPFEVLNELGVLRSGIHHRRIEKLYHSTNIVPQKALQAGFQFQYTLETALRDWLADCEGVGLC